MSKRFGRRQRRQAREKIAALEQTVVMDREIMRYASDEHSRLRKLVAEWDARARAIFGTESALKIIIEKMDHSMDRMRVPQRLRGVTALSDAETATMEIQKMLRVIARVERNDHSFSRYMIVNIMGADEFDRYGTAGYSISESMWHQLRDDLKKNGHRSRAADFLREDIARQLLAALAADQRGSRARA